MFFFFLLRLFFLFLFFFVVGVLFPSPMAIVLSKSQLSRIGEKRKTHNLFELLLILCNSPLFFAALVITSCTLERLPLFFRLSA